MHPAAPWRLLAVTSVAALGLAACTSGHVDPKVAKTLQLPPASPPVTVRPTPVPAPDTDLGIGKAVKPRPFLAPAKKPNLLMITMDDASWGDMPYMPHLQKLIARQGVTLRDGIAPTPICVPARATLLTGQYAHNHGALTISGAGGGFSSFADKNTLPTWLQAAGYDTLFTGKYLNGYGENGSELYVPPGWTRWDATVDPTTYDFENETLNTQGLLSNHRQYSTDLLSDESNRMLESPRREKKPWFMWASYVAPHSGGPADANDPARQFPTDSHPVKTTHPDARDLHTFDWLPLPSKPNMFEDVSDKKLIRHFQEWPLWRREELVVARQQRVEALQSVDRAIARTVATLRRTHQLGNTYIVVNSDNGFAVGEHNLVGKLWYFREILGVPTYLRGPGIPKGVTSALPMSQADWAPTFAALASATPARDVDGVNIIPWIGTAARSRIIPIEGYPVKGGRTPKYTGITLGPWTYVSTPSGVEELYDARTDRWQLTNQGDSLSLTPQREALAKLASAASQCAGGLCPHTFYR